MRSYLLLSCIFLNSYALASDYTLGVNGAWNRSSYKDGGDSDSGVGMNLGVSNHLYFTPEFFLRADLAYSIKNFGFGARYSYLEIPVLVGGQIALTETFSLYGATGPVINFLMSAKAGDVSTKENYRTFTASWALGTGVKYAVNESFGLSLDFRYDFPLMKAAKSTAFDASDSDATAKIHSVQAGLGAHWGF